MPSGYCAAYLIELAIGGTTIAPFDRPEMVMKINLMKITDAGMCETRAVFLRLFLSPPLLSPPALSFSLSLSPTRTCACSS